MNLGFKLSHLPLDRSPANQQNTSSAQEVSQILHLQHKLKLQNTSLWEFLKTRELGRKILSNAKLFIQVHKEV
jgi:hypothetical protein